MVDVNLSKLPEDWFTPGKYSKLKDILKDIYNKLEILDERTRTEEPVDPVQELFAILQTYVTDGKMLTQTELNELMEQWEN